MEVFAKLGIDWKLFLFQVINFGIVLFVLGKFLYRPAVNMLEERRKKIEEGLVFANDIKRKMKETEEEAERKIRQATDEAGRILKKARADAQSIKTELTEQARGEAKGIIQKAEREIGEEKEKVLSEIRREAGEVVALSAEKIIKEKIDREKDKNLIKEALQF